MNFWYDMAYDIRYCYYKFVEDLMSLRSDATADEVEEHKPDTTVRNPLTQ